MSPPPSPATPPPEELSKKEKKKKKKEKKAKEAAESGEEQIEVVRNGAAVGQFKHWEELLSVLCAHGMCVCVCGVWTPGAVCERMGGERDFQECCVSLDVDCLPDTSSK